MLGVTVILDDIRSALNVGAIFRTCDGAGVDKLILSGITPYPPHNKIPKTALGSIEHVNWQHYKERQELLSGLDLIKSPLISIEVTPNASDVYTYKFPQNCTLVFGNEISGVSSEYLQASSATIKVPMYGQKESLNVATTFGIVIYEVVRQRYFV